MEESKEFRGFKIREIMKLLVNSKGTNAALADELLIDESQLSRIMSGDRGMTLECIDKVVGMAEMVIMPLAALEALHTEINELEDAFHVISNRWDKERTRNGK